jgi:hypothetical protein
VQKGTARFCCAAVQRLHSVPQRSASHRACASAQRRHAAFLLQQNLPLLRQYGTTCCNMSHSQAAGREGSPSSAASCCCRRGCCAGPPAPYEISPWVQALPSRHRASMMAPTCSAAHHATGVSQCVLLAQVVRNELLVRRVVERGPEVAWGEQLALACVWTRQK